MQKTTRKDYTTWGSCYQLCLPLNVEAHIPHDDSVRLLRHFVEEMDLSALYRTYSHSEYNQASPRQMLAILIYANMNGIFSSRKIESSCKRDINFMYLLEGKTAPDHATVARFRSLHLAPCVKEIFAGMDKQLSDMGELSLENLFIDGTKIESRANKYKFVWKKAVTKQQQKIVDELPGFVADIGETFGVKLHSGKELKMYHLKRLRRKLKALQRESAIAFVHGTGKRKPPLQKAIEKLDEYIRRLKDYNHKIHIAGSRNSYAKTDPDATFMRMKEDAMKNGQLKPGYNIQFGVDAEYVVWVTEGPQPSDMTTLIPFLKDFEEHVEKRYRNIVADAGYESEENYSFLVEREQEAFIKPLNYEMSKRRSVKNDIGRRENMGYDAKEDTYTCANGRKLVVTGRKAQKTRTGYTTEKTLYACADCGGCELKTRCIHGNNSKLPMEERTKRFEVSKRFQEQRAAVLERLRSAAGIELRINRSIQSEGAFGEVKGNMGFRRFLSFGRKNALAESMLLAMAHNVNKLHHKIQSGNEGRYLFEVPVTA